MDIGAVIKAPMEDQDWIKKCAITGLMTLIPIVGAFNLLGWAKQYAKNRLAGDNSLPEAGLSYIGDGFKMFLAMLPMIGIVIGVQIVAGILGAILGKIAGMLAIVPSLAGLLVVLAISLVSPLFMYRHIVHDDAWASARIGWALGVAKANVGSLVMLFVIMIIANFIAGLGYIALIVGVFITMPLAQAITMAGIAEFANATNRA